MDVLLGLPRQRAVDCLIGAVADGEPVDDRGFVDFVHRRSAEVALVDVAAAVFRYLAIVPGRGLRSRSICRTTASGTVSAVESLRALPLAASLKLLPLAVTGSDAGREALIRAVQPLSRFMPVPWRCRVQPQNWSSRPGKRKPPDR